MDGEILLIVNDSDLELLIDDSSHRQIILNSVKKWAIQTKKSKKTPKDDKVKMRVNEWKRQNLNDDQEEGEYEEEKEEEDEEELQKNSNESEEEK